LTDPGVLPEGSIAVLTLTLTALLTKAASVNSVYSGLKMISTFWILYIWNRVENSVELGKSFRLKLKIPTEGLIPSQTMSNVPCGNVLTNVTTGLYCGCSIATERGIDDCGDLFWLTLRFAAR